MKAHFHWFLDFLHHVHGITEMFGRSLALSFIKPFYLRETVEQMYHIGFKSLSIVLMTSTFTGLVLAMQFGHEMSVFGAKMYTSSVLVVSLVRELGPVIISLVVAGRVGAGITAELGSMAVTEQIDAMRALGTNPYKKLAATRFLALSITLPLLVAIGDLCGMLGGWLVSVTSLGISSDYYWSNAAHYLFFSDIFAGLLKPFIFAMTIASISCYLGFSVTGGTKGVGEATTRSVVVSSILIFILDFLITKVTLGAI
ncbi:ABC transporter permease [candidate division KSB1 bacterium]|nr:ABC transporter permease [candidate division KSB1 bacterium]RQW02795.1 MAG: ABC transporter permease [candidate division KSB1 bacterium]